MRRVRYYQYGGPDVLTVEEAEIPTPAAGQVRIKVEAIGANFVDTKFRRGPSAGTIFQRPLPGLLTGDVVGTVEGTGERVATLVEDAFAEYVVADAEWLVPVPAGVEAGPASMLALAGPVAIGTLRTAAIGKGETVLVHSAAGSIGHLATQIAKELGAGTVIGTAGSAAKLDFVREHGADVAIDYSADDWPDRVREVAPAGVDVVLDAVGGETMLRSIDLLAPRGRLVAYGAASGELTSIPITSVFALRSLTGYSTLALRGADPAGARRDMNDVSRLIATGRLNTAVHVELPLAEAAQAHRILEGRANLGRVVLRP
ncbi:quinone oxidoreductase family protein [Pseudonocardia sp. TRM90224]|uniref:quinone oxidoreductase family protein n=1 Tax=Pseudonocardia sp. TRM90224 TaxID=2812678 RepID=UPI001E28F48C|nr:zinc-binding dehydrogenase [Pseudonocardia sp. TRM90224]